MRKTLLFFAGFFLVVSSIKAQKADTSVQTQTADTTIYEKEQLDTLAHFKGGVHAWQTFIQNNLRMDVAVQNGAPAGGYTAIVRFMVTKEGKLMDITPQSNTGYGTERELVRLMKKMPDWAPAIKNGKPVNSWCIQPLTFSVGY